jgi:hypothetical protein
MTPEEALRNILSLVDGSDEVEDSRSSNRHVDHRCSQWRT